VEKRVEGVKRHRIAYIARAGKRKRRDRRPPRPGGEVKENEVPATQEWPSHDEREPDEPSRKDSGRPTLETPQRPGHSETIAA
jgi:hypothetical protein